MVNEKTLTMRLHHVVFRWRGFIERLRIDSKWAGPRTRHYYESIAKDLEKTLNEVMQELGNLEYVEVSD